MPGVSCSAVLQQNMSTGQIKKEVIGSLFGSGKLFSDAGCVFSRLKACNVRNIALSLLLSENFAVNVINNFSDT